jgi:hypothetical protein
MTDAKGPDWTSLISVPDRVVKYLRGHPPLLIGMGGATLLAIVAIFAPGDKAMFGWLISVLVFLTCLIWAITGVLRPARRAGGGAELDPGQPGNWLQTEEKSQVQDLDMNLVGESGRNVVEAGRKSQISGVRMGITTAASGPALPAAPAPAPEPPAAAPTPPAVAPPDEAEPELATVASGVVAANLFVGRRAELDTVLELLETTRDGAVVDVVGVRGVGKSALLDQVAVEVGRRPGRLVRRVNMAETVDGYRDDSGVDASLAVLEHTFTQAVLLMRTFAGDGNPLFAPVWERVEETRRSVTDLRISNTVQVGDNARASRLGLNNSVTVNLPEQALRSGIRRAQSALDEAFVRAWAEFTARRRVLITIDSFERCADDELGHWIRRLALRLPNTVVVVARMPSDAPVPVGSDRLHQRWLANFNPDEVALYLNRRLRRAALAREVVDVVHDFTEGHPGGVYLMGELISARGPDRLSARELAQIARHLPDDPQEAWATLVDEILTAMRERSTVRAAAVVSSFNQPLLASLTDGDQAAAAATIDALYRRRLLRTVRTPSGEPTGWYRMHEFIRQSVARRMRAEDPRGWQELHSRAAAHFYQLLDNWDDTQGGYGAMYRYEHPDWQRYKREWLYHSGYLTERRALTRTRFALVFLDAFWWWGCYHPFDFNRHLLDDWERACDGWQPLTSGPHSADAEHQRDQQFGEALRFMLNSYPTGHAKPPTAPWAQIGDRLRLVRRLCSPDPGQQGSAGTPEANRVAALIELFLAHTRRYADPHDERADRSYARARAGFATVGDDWTVAWIDMECADLALQRGRYEEIGPLVDAAARAAVTIGLGEDGTADDWDHELLANLHRIRADAAWRTGDLAEAAAGYGRAVADAYWFQRIPHPPDEYTQQFYDEITQRGAQPVADLVARGDEAAGLEFARVLVRAVPVPSTVDGDLLLRLVRAGQPAALRQALFPPGPTTRELRSEDSPFLTRWDEAREDALDPQTSAAPLLAADPAAAD